VTALATSALARLAATAGKLAEAAQGFADADFLTTVATGLYRDGLPKHAARAGKLAARKKAAAEAALAAITNQCN